MKTIYYKLKQNISLFIFLLSFILLNVHLIFATNINENNSKNYFRIHVVANSDSIDDQILKLNVSKKVDEYICEITKDLETKEDYKKCVTTHIQDILVVANNVLKDNNINYKVKAYIGNMYYDEKAKDSFTMESGIYDSLKIVIGNGEGENWWSLIFPYTILEENEDNICLEDIKTESFLLNFFKNIKRNAQG